MVCVPVLRIRSDPVLLGHPDPEKYRIRTRIIYPQKDQGRKLYTFAAALGWVLNCVFLVCHIHSRRDDSIRIRIQITILNSILYQKRLITSKIGKI